MVSTIGKKAACHLVSRCSRNYILPFFFLVGLQIRQSLDQLMDQMKHFPARLKTYASFDHMQRTLRGYLKINVLVTELKSEALKVSK